MQCDVVIFGGGVAGLWLLDTLVERGQAAVLLEAGDLGSGQTVASQGIIHGGLKYTLQGLLTSSAANIAEMPGLWRECLHGRRTPDLSQTRVRSEHCHLWRTDSIASRMGMIGAKFGLRVAPQTVANDERPEALRHCPGDVARLDEQVISPASLIANFAARHAGRLLKIDATAGLRFETTSQGVSRIHLARPDEPHETLTFEPRFVVLTAGAGNAGLRDLVGLSSQAMQRRPLHMLMVRGRSLPVLNGHCVDGSRTRVTVTSDVDSDGRTVWQVGGQIAEEGVTVDPRTLVERGRRELEAAIPRLELSQAEFATYRVDRAEAATSGGRRPETFQVLRDGNVFTAWPTKLVLAPVLAESLGATLASEGRPSMSAFPSFAQWPVPTVALPPWEAAAEWHTTTSPVRRAA
ncbi:MAG: FAD-dependent oxidoreductase [Planctomycetaceae bacterium]|nr:FAD-dependent oxidoreductase [Planctomycetaceae bacterium]